ncbi:MAG: hypothetical protein KBT27_15350 [Prevotellaceae bacterium]|nr:hypothetical protein [Candidatus Faecinaster equi]
MANVFDNVTVAEHQVCESSMLRATITGPIYSLKCHKALDNGEIVTYGDYVGNQVFDSADYAAGKAPLLVLSVPFAYSGERRAQDEKYFYNAKDEIARAYPLYKGDIWTVSADAFEGTPEVGKFIDATYTVADQAGSTGLVGKIIDKVNYKNSVSYRVFCESNGL